VAVSPADRPRAITKNRANKQMKLRLIESVGMNLNDTYRVGGKQIARARITHAEDVPQ
jgi:hypothetical protein